MAGLCGFTMWPKDLSLALGLDKDGQYFLGIVFGVAKSYKQGQ